MRSCDIRIIRKTHGRQCLMKDLKDLSCKYRVSGKPGYEAIIHFINPFPVATACLQLYIQSGNKFILTLHEIQHAVWRLL